MANPISVPQNFSTTLNVGGGINDSQTTGIILTSVTGLPTDGGMLAFDWASTIDAATIEYIEYTGISGNELTGVTRGQEGYSAKAHSNGCTVVGVLSQAHIKRLRDKLTANDTTAIQDPNGNEVLKSGYVSSAVNEITVTNAATGGGPTLSATGGDTNIDINIQPKGTGVTNIKGTATSAAEVRLFEDTDNGSNYLGFKAPAAVTASKTFTLPDGDGSSGQFLSTNGSATLSWASAGSATVYANAVGSDFTTSSTSVTDVTDGNQSVTTSETKNILVIATIKCQNDTDAAYFQLYLRRDSTTLITATTVPAAASTGDVRTLTWMDTSLAAGTYDYKISVASQSGKTTRVLAGSQISVIVF